MSPHHTHHAPGENRARRQSENPPQGSPRQSPRRPPGARQAPPPQSQTHQPPAQQPPAQQPPAQQPPAQQSPAQQPPAGQSPVQQSTGGQSTPREQQASSQGRQPAPRGQHPPSQGQQAVASRPTGAQPAAQQQPTQQPAPSQQPTQPRQPSRVGQEAPGVPQVQLVEDGDEYVHVRFRDPDAFDTIRTPDWAAHAARSVSRGAEVRTGKLRGSDDWTIESVLLRKPISREQAVGQAVEVVRKIEN